MKSRQILVLSCGILSGVSSIQAKPAKEPLLSERKKALSPTDQLKSFKVPKGFVVELVASEENGLINPIDIAFDDAGRLWTQTAQMYPMDPVGDMPWADLRKLMQQDPKKIHAKMPEYGRIKNFYTLQTKGEDKILVIDDPTKQVKGQIRAFATGLSIPQSILPYKNGVFVAHGSEMLYFHDEDKDGHSDKHSTILTGFGFNDSHTMPHTLVRGPGGWLHRQQTQKSLNPIITSITWRGSKFCFPNDRRQISPRTNYSN